MRFTMSPKVTTSPHHYILMALLLSGALLLTAVLANLPILFPLLGAWVLFSLAIHKLHFSFSEIWQMSRTGIATSYKIIEIFLFIGLLIALWQAGGTLPTLIAYSLEMVNPYFFVPSAFLLSALISMLTGSAFGTIGTIGLALITIAKLGDMPLDLIAGALVSGAYVGDRSSLMSSSAALVATLTHTKITANMQGILRTLWVPTVLCILVYIFLAWHAPLPTIDNHLIEEINQTFVITPMMLAPALLMLLLVLLKFKVKTAMGVSSAMACILAIAIQNTSLIKVLQYAVIGFQLPPDSPLHDILKGGGILSMVQPALIVITACALSSLIEEAGLLSLLQHKLQKIKKRSQLFAINVLLSLGSAAIGCSQAVAIVMTYYMLRKVYNKNQISPSDIAPDFENSAIILSPLIPWNISALLPTVMLGVSMTAYLPYAFFLYFTPLTYWLLLRSKE